MDDLITQPTSKPLPESILNHLNSRETIDVIYSIEKAFAIDANDIRVIPVIISGVITDELKPSDVVAALKTGLNTTDESAVKIASIIKEKILNPIAGGLLLTTGIDIEPIPGPSAKNAVDLPELVEELKPYLEQIKKTEEAKAVKPVTAPAKAGAKTASGPEPLPAAPKGTYQPVTPPKPAGIGMETPGLRIMKDVKPPVVAAKPIEVKKPDAQPTPAPKIVAAPRPFMLHEEKPVAPSEPTSLRMSSTFSFDAGAAPVSRQAARPVAAQLNSSSEAVLDQKKPITPVIAKTAEVPKVVHYTSMRTPLEEEKPTNNS